MCTPERGATSPSPRSACPVSIDSVALSRNGRTLAIGCDGPPTNADNTGRGAQLVARMDIASTPPRLLSVDPAGLSVDALSVSPDGRTVVVAEEDHAGGGFQVMTLVNDHLRGAEIDRANGNFVGPAAFAADGRELVTAFSDGRVVLWRISASGLQRDQLATTGIAGITSLAFSPDSSELAAGDSEGRVRIWDLPSQALLGTVTQQPWSLDSLAFTPDGRSLIAGSAGSTDDGNAAGSVISLAADVPSWIHAACAIVNRNLSAAEWRQFAPTVAHRSTCPGPR